jgi:hypothetical protein
MTKRMFLLAVLAMVLLLMFSIFQATSLNFRGKVAVKELNARTAFINPNSKPMRAPAFIPPRAPVNPIRPSRRPRIRYT